MIIEQVAGCSVPRSESCPPGKHDSDRATESRATESRATVSNPNVTCEPLSGAAVSTAGVLARVGPGGATLQILSNSDPADPPAVAALPLGIETVWDPQAAGPEPLAAWVDQHAAAGLPVVLAVDSRWAHLCYFAADRRLAGGQSLAFEIESHLPIDAESMTVTVRRVGDWVHCLAVPNAPLVDWIERLESAGLPVHHVVAESLIIAQQMIQLGGWDDGSESSLVLPIAGAMQPDGGWVELLRISGGVPIAWSLCADEPEELRREAALQRLASPSAGALDDSTEPAIRRGATEAGGGELRRAAAAVLRGQLRPWFECRRGELARHDSIRSIRPALLQLATVASVGLLVLSTALWLRGGRLAGVAAGAGAAAASAYAETFPGQRMPTSPLRRLRAERQKYAATTTTASQDVRHVDAGQLLRGVIRSVAGDPDGVPRVRIESLRIDDGQLDLELVCESTEGISGVTDSLALAGWQLQRPTTLTAADDRLRVRVRGQHGGGDTAVATPRRLTQIEPGRRR